MSDIKLITRQSIIFFDARVREERTEHNVMRPARLRVSMSYRQAAAVQLPTAHLSGPVSATRRNHYT